MNLDLVGHEWAVKLLAKHIQTGNIKHAYLFCGPEGIGRRSLAVHFAQALTCTHAVKTGEPCLKCSSCQRIRRLQHPDLFVVSTLESKWEIRIDQIRNLQHDLSLTPFEASLRIGLLLDFQNANVNAQNAMLKTLEEPSPHAVLLLTASRPEDLLPTVASRCEILLLRPASIETVASELERREGADKNIAMKLAQLSSGCYGIAYTLYRNPAEIGRINHFIERMLVSLSSPLSDRFAYAEELTQKKSSARDNLSSAIKTWLTFWRDVLMTASGSNTTITNPDFVTPIHNVANSLSISEINSQISHLEKGLDQLEKNANARLLAEVLLMDLPNINPPVRPRDGQSIQ